MREKILCGVITLVFFVNFASGITFQDCSADTVYVLKALAITGCSDDDNRCTLRIGSIVNVTAEFIPRGNDKSQMLIHCAFWEINLITTKAVVTPDVCMAEECPQRNPLENTATYTASLLVDENLPPFKASLIWRLNSDDNNEVMCYKVPITLRY